MRARWIFVFDTAVLLGVGVYMTLTVWGVPEPLRHKLLTVSLHALARLTGMAG